MEFQAHKSFLMRTPIIVLITGTFAHVVFIQRKKILRFQLPSVPEKKASVQKKFVTPTKISVRFSVCFQSFTGTKLFASSLQCGA